MMKKYILAVIILVALFSCDTKRNEALQQKVDSLSVQWTATREVVKSMNAQVIITGVEKKLS